MRYLKIVIFFVIIIYHHYISDHDQTLKNRELDKIDIPCEEQQVLDADVHRTRSDVKEFTSQAWRQVLRDILQNFCLSHDVQYKQGMNEVTISSLS